MAKGKCRSCLRSLWYAKLNASRLQFQTIHFLIELSGQKMDDHYSSKVTDKLGFDYGRKYAAEETKPCHVMSFLKITTSELLLVSFFCLSLFPNFPFFHTPALVFSSLLSLSVPPLLLPLSPWLTFVSSLLCLLLSSPCFFSLSLLPLPWATRLWCCFRSTGGISAGAEQTAAPVCVCGGMHACYHLRTSIRYFHSVCVCAAMKISVTWMPQDSLDTFICQSVRCVWIRCLPMGFAKGYKCLPRSSFWCIYLAN